MMRSLSISLLAVMLASAHSWTTTRSMRATTSFVRLSMASDPEQTDDPCWQELYDDDCAMGSVLAATFVAGEWIKSMPCAQGLDEDCDMGTLDVPGGRPEAGVDQVDVMAFLGLKKAESLSKPKGDDEVAP